MIIKETKLKGSYIIKLSTKCDNRGYFNRLYCDKEFLKKLNTKWVQVNLSSSKKIGTLRGLHIQMHASSETKLIRCTRGMIWDVIVDLRKNLKLMENGLVAFYQKLIFKIYMFQKVLLMDI